MVMEYLNPTGIQHDLSYIRNAPHFHGLDPNENPRLAGYSTAAGVALGAGSTFGFIANRLASVAGNFADIIINGASSGTYPHVFEPYDKLKVIIENGPESLVVATTLAGVAAGARLGTAAGRRAADFWTRVFSDRSEVTERVRNYYLDTGMTPAGADRAARRYMNSLL
jgi:hypothetical protein